MTTTACGSSSSSVSKPLGYDVVHANGGEEGLRLLEDERPQLLIVDYAMPGMTGVDVIKQARSRSPHLPIILATGYADMGAVEQVMALDKVLRKPFRIEDLDMAVRDALREVDAAMAGSIG